MNDRYDLARLRREIVNAEQSAKRLAALLVQRDDLMEDYAVEKALGCWLRARLCEAQGWQESSLSYQLDVEAMSWWAGFEVGPQLLKRCEAIADRLFSELQARGDQAAEFWRSPNLPELARAYD